MKLDPDPTRPEELTRMLRRAGVLSRSRVERVEWERIGQFSNELWRLRLSYDRNAHNAPASLVLKRPRAEATGDRRQALELEARFYRELAARTPVRTPRLYRGTDALLLLEDVSGFLPIDWRRGASDDHARSAIEDLARLHAHGFHPVEEVEGVDGLDWIPSFADAAHRASYGRSFDAGWKERRALLGAIEPAFVAIGDALVGHVPTSLAPLGDDSTLLHGDAHLENLAPVESPDGERCLLFHDWAGIHRGLAGFDLAVFLVMSFPPERRRDLERGLVTLHSDALHAAGARARDDPWLDYRRGVLGWAVRMVEFAGAFGTDAVGRAALQMVAARCATAAVDHRVEELIA